jgi:hypothetical protein
MMGAVIDDIYARIFATSDADAFELELAAGASGASRIPAKRQPRP